MIFTGKSEGEIYHEILERLLAAPELADLNKSQSSMAYTMLAPVAAELATAYGKLHQITECFYADTADLDSLILKAKEIGLTYRDKSPCVVLAEIDADRSVPLGERFAAEELVFYVSAVTEDGMYELTCEIAGDVGDPAPCEMIYLGYLSGIRKAMLVGVKINGCEAESLEELRGRYYEKVEAEAFGGNKAAYREFVLGLPKVGGCRIDRAGEIDAATAAQYPNANVFVTVIGEDYDMPDADDLIAIETAINGDNASGDAGLGFAPIDHRPLVLSVLREQVYFAVTAELKNGYTTDAVLPRLKEKAREIVRTVGEDWAKHGGGTLKKSAVFAAMLTAEGVADISELTMKAVVAGSDGNNELLTCNARSYTDRYIPYLSNVTLTIGGGGI